MRKKRYTEVQLALRALQEAELTLDGTVQGHLNQRFRPQYNRNHRRLRGDRLISIASRLCCLLRYFACHPGLKDIMKILLRNKRVDVDLETEGNKQTPLLTACICGNYEIVRLLLLAGAEPNKPNLLHQSPLAATLFRLV